MGHIRQLSGRYSLFGFSPCVRGRAAGSAGGGSTILRQRGWLIGAVILPAMLLAFAAGAQPRGTPARAQQQGPALPPTGHQTEPVDLNEGQSPAELFKAGCAVCHQSAAGLARGRREGELANFLRQHYTSSAQHAGMLANFLAATGRGAPAVAAPSRQAPVERPPAPIGRRGPDDDRKPQEAARPPEPASRRKPPVAAARTPPPAAAAAEASPTEPEPAAEPSTSASSPPVEDKPPPPEIPL
jgi:hypothetical protein